MKAVRTFMPTFYSQGKYNTMTNTNATTSAHTSIGNVWNFCFWMENARERLFPEWSRNFYLNQKHKINIPLHYHHHNYRDKSPA